MKNLSDFKLSIKGKSDLNTYRSFVRGEISRRDAYPTAFEFVEDSSEVIFKLGLHSTFLGVSFNEIKEEGLK